MDWFKHKVGSHDDPDISGAWDEFGYKGYVIFFVLLELYGREFRRHDNGEITFSWKFLQRKMRSKRKVIELVLIYFSKQGRMKLKQNENEIGITIPKFIELASEWTKRVKPEHSGVTSEITQENLKTDKEVDVDKEVEEEKTMVLNTTIAKPQKKEPEILKPESVKTLTPVQVIVEHYKKVGKFEDVPNWDKAYFPRCTKPAKQLLDLSEGDIEQAKKAITEIIGHLQGEGLSWTLETVVKQFGHWKSGKLIPSKDRRLTGNIEAGRKFLQRGESDIS